MRLIKTVRNAAFVILVVAGVMASRQDAKAYTHCTTDACDSSFCNDELGECWSNSGQWEGCEWDVATGYCCARCTVSN